MIRVYAPQTNTMRRRRRTDFHANENSPYISVSTLFHDICRQRIIEEVDNQKVEKSEAI